MLTLIEQEEDLLQYVPASSLMVQKLLTDPISSFPAPPMPIFILDLATDQLPLYNSFIVSIPDFVSLLFKRLLLLFERQRYREKRRDEERSSIILLTL